jgi:hypothetical protein
MHVSLFSWQLHYNEITFSLFFKYFFYVTFWGWQDDNMCCTNYSIIIHVTAYDGLLQIFVVSITDNMCLTCIIVLHKPMCFIINKHLFAYHARSASAICLHPFSIEKCCFHDLRWVYLIQQYVINLVVTCGMSVDFSEYSGFLHQ